MTKHIHEVYGYMGVYSCVSCPEQFTLQQVNEFNNIKIKSLQKQENES